MENDVFRILGRTSVDIIKSGGYKISALDVERVLVIRTLIYIISLIRIQGSVRISICIRLLLP